MTGTSTILSDYLGRGLASARPGTLDLSPGALGVYFATDTGALSLWNGSAWVAYSGGSSGVSSIGGVTGAISLGTGISISGSTLNVTGGSSGVTYPQIVQSASIEAGGTLALPEPVTVGNYLAVFLNQATALANFNGVPLLQTAGSSTQQALLFGQVATSTTGPSAAISGNGYIVEVSGSSSQSSSVVTMGAKNGETVSCTVSVAAGSILLFATAPYGGSYDDTVMIAPAGVAWLSSGQLVGYQAYGFGVYSVPCPVTNPALQIALRSPSQTHAYAAVLELTH